MTCPLTDIEAGAWYADAVIWAYNAGVVSGYEDGTFRPGRTITRQEMAVMFYGMLSGGDSLLDEDEIQYALAQFATAHGRFRGRARRSLTATSAGSWSATTGCFDPLGSLERAQLAQVFCSFYETR